MNRILVKDLEIAKELAHENIIEGSTLPRMTLTRLRKMNWLTEIIRGWYIFKPPTVHDGESTLWYANFWSFLKQYLKKNYGDDYCLNPVSSIYLKTESCTIPNQVIVMLDGGGGQTLNLPFGTSLLLYAEKKNFPTQIEKFNELNIIELPKALTMVPESYFSNHEAEAEIALCMVKNPSEITKYLVDGQPAKAEILAGAYRFLEKEDFVEQIKSDMLIVAYKINPKNPFIKEKPTLNRTRINSPAVARIELMWQKYRETVIAKFPKPSVPRKNLEEVLKEIKEIYVHDAYNSLSIEGYVVTEELIRKIASGSFDLEMSEEDKKNDSAMAAKGYFLAYTAVSAFIKENYGKKYTEIKLQKEIQGWYQQLFTPKVQSGLAAASLLIGYRNKPVFIRGSRHTPVNFSIVGEVMEQYLELLDKEVSPAARAILGHFILVFIHPFADGNGRTSRFVMNAALVLAGYNWTVIRNEKKSEYFKALEEASVNGKIEAFVEFVIEDLNYSAKFIREH